MKKIELSEDIFKLDIGDELRVKDYKKLQPVMNEFDESQPVKLALEMLKALCVDEEDDIEERVDNLKMSDFKELNEELTDIMYAGDQKKTEE